MPITCGSLEPDRPLADAQRRARCGQPLPQIGSSRFVDPADRNEPLRRALAALALDDLDCREPANPAGEPRDLPVEAERRVDEAGGAE